MNEIKNIFLILTILTLFGCGTGDSANDSLPVTNKAGSMAAFAIAKDVLYTIDKNTLVLFDISNPAMMVKKKVIYLQGDLSAETLYPYNERLFIGTPQGLLIYSITDPENPVYLSKYEHVVSCDPVVAKGNLAYATLRSGTRCMRGVNQLEVIDITDIKNMKAVSIYSKLTNPHGLDIDDSNVVVVCDGDHGFKILNGNDSSNIKLLCEKQDSYGYDVILIQKRAIITGRDGIYQYSYNDPKVPELLSKIPVHN